MLNACRMAPRLQSSEQRRKRPQVSEVCGLERLYVFNAQISIDDERQQFCPKEDQRYKYTGNSAIAILIRVYLRKTMMEPR